MYCKKCGEFIPDGKNVCPKCGQEMFMEKIGEAKESDKETEREISSSTTNILKASLISEEKIARK